MKHLPHGTTLVVLALAVSAPLLATPGMNSIILFDKEDMLHGPDGF
jgi:hypothetical protein